MTDPWRDRSRARARACRRARRSVRSGGADAARKGQKLCKPEAAVAAHARVRRLASSVAPDERRYDRAAELLTEIEREVREAKTMARITGRGDGGGRAAHPLGVGAAGVRPEAERDADGLEAFVAGTEECNCTVDPAAHRDGNTPLADGCDRGRSQGVMQGLGSQSRGRHRGCFEHWEPPDSPAEFLDPVALAGGVLHAAGTQGQSHPGQVGPEGRVPDHVHAANVAKKDTCPTAPMMLRT